MALCRKRHLKPLREVFDELQKSPENIEALRRNGLLDAENTSTGDRVEVLKSNGDSHDPPVYEMTNAVDRRMLFDRSDTDSFSQSVSQAVSQSVSHLLSLSLSACE